MRRTPALIIGGGPAGATLALRLAQAGLPHLLLERTRDTADALCGGFLSWRTLAMLERLGIEAQALNPTALSRVRLFARGRTAEAALPQLARAVSRRRLDTLLLTAAERAGAAVERGVAVRGVKERTALLADGTSLAADALFLATGKHDLRDLARPASARGEDPTIGLRVRLQASAVLQRCIADAIELHLLDRAYAGLVQQEDGAGNLCLAVRRSRLTEAGSAERLLSELGAESPALGERLAHRTTASPIHAVANVPYGWRATNSNGEGLFRLGDQAAVIPSLAGEGMAIAIASGMAAARFYAQGGPAGANAFQSSLAEGVYRPIKAASVAWRIAERPHLAEAATLLARAIPALLPLLARMTRIRELGRP